MTIATVDPINVSIATAASVLGISRTRAYELAAAGKLPGAYRPEGLKRRILVNLEILRAESRKQAEGLS